jgi:hypothetical protein
MKNKRLSLIILMGCAIIIFMIAQFVHQSRRPIEEKTIALYAIPELQNKLNSVSGIHITTAEEKTAVTLSKKENGWVVNERHFYPANTGKLRELLFKLADAKLVEKKTNNEKHFPDIHLSDLKDKDSKSILVSLDGLEKPAHLMIGQYSFNHKSTFVRHPNDKQTWLAKGDLTVESDPARWLENKVFSLDESRIFDIQIKNAAQETIHIFRGDKDVWQMDGIPSDKVLRSEVALSNIAATLSDFSLVDVFTENERPLPSGEAGVSTATFKDRRGLVITARGWESEGRDYFTIKPEIDLAKAEEFIKEDQAKNKVEKESEDLALRLEGVKKELDAIKNSVSGFVFMIYPDRHSNISRKIETLLVDNTKESKQQ